MNWTSDVLLLGGKRSNCRLMYTNCVTWKYMEFLKRNEDLVAVARHFLGFTAPNKTCPHSNCPSRLIPTAINSALYCPPTALFRRPLYVAFDRRVSREIDPLTWATARPEYFTPRAKKGSDADGRSVTRKAIFLSLSIGTARNGRRRIRDRDVSEICDP